MISVHQATQIIEAAAWVAPVGMVPLSEATGRVLREPIRADRDFPPFHRVMMDGIAIRFEAVSSGLRSFEVLGVQQAGEPPRSLNDDAQCWEVMTGAVLPLGADAVIRYEDLEFSSRGSSTYAQVRVLPEKRWHHVHRQASDRPAGDLLIPVGKPLRPADIGVAASVGKAFLSVSQALSVAVVSTGDELVDVEATPLSHQIRRSNAYTLAAAFIQAGARVQSFHFPDDRSLLTRGLSDLLPAFDCLVLSGGVSMGKADFVPEVLEALSVVPLFHQVAQRPGKPFWFGRTTAGKTVFALPGNPVSTLLCAYRYVIPWLHACAQALPTLAPLAVLSERIEFKPALTYFLPVYTHVDAEGRWQAVPRPGGGSGDFANLLEANAFLELPAEASVFEAGQGFPLWPL